MLQLKALYQDLRIKYKMFVLISGVMLSMIVLFIAVQQYAFEVYDEEIYRQSAKALNLTSYSIENELKKMERLSYRVTIDPAIQTLLTTIERGGTDYDKYVVAKNIRDRMVSLVGSEEYVLSMQMFDAFNGEYAIGVHPVTTSAERVQLMIRETNQNEGGNTWITPDGGDIALHAARMIRAYDELKLDRLGMMAVRIDMGKLFADYAMGLVSSGAKLVILDNNRAVYPPKAPIPPSKLLAHLTSSQGYKIVDQGGKRFFVTYVTSDYMNWTYTTIIPYDTIFQRIVAVKNIVLALFILSFILAVVFTFRLSRGITDPIERLNAKMKRVQLGSFDYSEEPDERPIAMDEAGQLHRNFRIMVERIDQLIQEDYIKQLVIKESEFKALQAQINPHFLYNTLETINWSAKMNGQRQISEMVESLGFLLRSSISMKDPLIPLKYELDIIGHYIAIQRFRFEDRLDFCLEVPESLHACRIPKLSLQPLVENAINYGLERMVDTCFIRVAASEQNGYILLEVADNGPGMDSTYLDKIQREEIKPKGSGVGLRNINERIKLLYGEEYGLKVESERYGGTRIKLKMPCNRSDN